MSTYYKSLRQKVGHQLLMMPAVAAIIRDDEGRVLLMRQSSTGDWSLPAGAIEPGETPVESVVREVAEETGYEVVPGCIAGVLGGPAMRVTYPNGDIVEATVVFFDCEIMGGELEAIDGEAMDFGWFAPGEFPVTGVEYPLELFTPGYANRRSDR